MPKKVRKSIGRSSKGKKQGSQTQTTDTELENANMEPVIDNPNQDEEEMQIDMTDATRVRVYENSALLMDMSDVIVTSTRPKSSGAARE